MKYVKETEEESKWRRVNSEIEKSEVGTKRGVPKAKQQVGLA